MTTSTRFGYAFALSLPAPEDDRLRLWAEATPGASWDVSGGHVTLVRFTGSRQPESLVLAMHEACAGVGPFEAAFTLPSHEPYWGRPASRSSCSSARPRRTWPASSTCGIAF